MSCLIQINCLLPNVDRAIDPPIYFFNAFIDMENDHYMSCFTAADQFADRFTLVLKLLLIDGTPCLTLLAAGTSLLLNVITQDQIDVDGLFVPFEFT